MFGGLSWKIVAVQFIVMAVLAGMAYWYWTWSQNRIASLVQENTALTVAVKTQTDTIDHLQNRARDQAEQIGQLQQSLTDAEKDRKAVEAKLRRLNLAQSARNNPQELEAKINQDIGNTFLNIEQLTTPGHQTGAAEQSSGPSTNDTPVSGGSTNQAPAPLRSNDQPPPRPPVRAKN